MLILNYLQQIQSTDQKHIDRCVIRTRVACMESDR